MLKGKASSQCCIIALSILLLLFFQKAVAAAEYGASPADEGMEVLTRGPIHEAFAEVSVDDAKPEIAISRSVPEPINEIPPDYRPEGNNVQWIPGYWSWDDDQNDFIWVSGVWRDVPPGRQWVPGYWIAVAGGNQFVSGYWAETDQTQTVYFPPPPEPPPTAPGVPAYSSDNIWVDGHWLWSNNGYVWQAGSWLRQRPEMAWIPAHYVWTPRGYIFVRGYWDYQLVRRGVMFAPRYYSRPIYRAHDYYYTPSIVLDIDTIFLSLFIRQNHHHYYFGDYHDVRYERRGFIPWYSKHATKHGYDPYYRSYRWYQSRHDDRWEHNYQKQFEYRRDHREARPPVRYRSQEDHNFTRPHGEKNQMLGRSYAEVVKKNERDGRFTRSRPDDTKDYREYGRKITVPKVERRPVEVVPARKEKTWQKRFATSDDQKNRATAPYNGRINWANDPERQPQVVQESKHGKQYPRMKNQLQVSQTGRQPQQNQNIWRTVNEQPRIDQQQREPLQMGKQSDTSKHSNQSRRIEPNKRDRTVQQPQQNQERRQPMMVEGQKNIERRARQEKNIAGQVPEQKSAPSRVKTKGKRSVDSEAQVEGEDTVIQADGQIIKRPRGVWGQQANRSYEK